MKCRIGWGLNPTYKSFLFLNKVLEISVLCWKFIWFCRYCSRRLLIMWKYSGVKRWAKSLNLFRLLYRVYTIEDNKHFLQWQQPLMDWPITNTRNCTFNIFKKEICHEKLQKYLAIKETFLTTSFRTLL